MHLNDSKSFFWSKYILIYRHHIIDRLTNKLVHTFIFLNLTKPTDYFDIDTFLYKIMGPYSRAPIVS